MFRKCQSLNQGVPVQNSPSMWMGAIKGYQKTKYFSKVSREKISTFQIWYWPGFPRALPPGISMKDEWKIDRKGPLSNFISCKGMFWSQFSIKWKQDWNTIRLHQIHHRNVRNHSDVIKCLELKNKKSVALVNNLAKTPSRYSNIKNVKNC